MDSAQKALDALEAANAERTQGVWFAADVTGRKAPDDGIRVGGTSAWAVYSNAKNRARHSRDAKATALSVNLAAPLAAVVRAASRRLWWQVDTAHGEDADGNDAYQQREVCCGCGARREEGSILPYATSHRDGLMSECPMLETDAALDAFNACAAAQGFGAPEPPAANAPEPPAEIVNPRARAYCRAVGIPPTVEAIRARDGNWASFMAWIAARSREFRIRSGRDVVGADAPFTAFCEEAAARAVAESAGRG